MKARSNSKVRQKITSNLKTSPKEQVMIWISVFHRTISLVLGTWEFTLLFDYKTKGSKEQMKI